MLLARVLSLALPDGLGGAYDGRTSSLHRGHKSTHAQTIQKPGTCNGRQDTKHHVVARQRHTFAPSAEAADLALGLFKSGWGWLPWPSAGKTSDRGSHDVGVQGEVANTTAELMHYVIGPNTRCG